MTDPIPIEDDQHYQTFRARGNLVRIPIVPTLANNAQKYVIWSDILDCFPDVLRIQNGDLYVGLLRGPNLFRVRPHGIKHHPGVILDVIFKDNTPTSATTTKTSVPNNATRSAPSSAPSAGGSATKQPNGSSSLTTTAASSATPVRSKRPEPPRPNPQQQQALSANGAIDLNSEDAFLDVITRSLNASLALDASSSSPSSSTPQILKEVNGSKTKGGKATSINKGDAGKSMSRPVGGSIRTTTPGNTPLEIALNSLPSPAKMKAMMAASKTASTSIALTVPMTPEEEAEAKKNNSMVQVTVPVELGRLLLEATEPGKTPEEIKEIEERFLIASTAAQISESTARLTSAATARNKANSSKAAGAPSSTSSTSSATLIDRLLATARSVNNSNLSETEQRILEAAGKAAAKADEEKRLADASGKKSTASSSDKSGEKDMSAALQAAMATLASKERAIDVKQGAAPVSTTTSSAQATSAATAKSTLGQGNTSNKDKVVVATAATKTQDRPWLKDASDGIAWLDSTLANRPPIDKVFTFDNDDELVLEIVGHRVRDIIDRRYRWAEGLTPKFFIPILMKHMDSTEKGEDANKVPPPKNFALQFCCDCGDIPNNSHDRIENSNGNMIKTWYPHWVPHSHAHPIKSKHLLDLITIYGEYMMGVLEMLLWGAYLDENRRVVAYNRDGKFLAHLYMSMHLLKDHGFVMSRDLLEKTRHLTREERAEVIPRIKPLEDAEDFNQLMRFMDSPRPCMSDLHTFVTDDRDSRWLCKAHLYTLRPNAALPDDSSPSKPVPPPVCPTIIKSAAQAQEFYAMIPFLETCVTRFRLDWDLSGSDFAKLAEAVARCTSVAVTVDIRCQDRFETPITGFERGDLGEVLIAALLNKHIEVFSFGGLDPEYSAMHDDDELATAELYDLGTIANFARDVRSGRIKLKAKVLGVDMSVNTLRRAVKGFHHLSSLQLEIDSIWDKVVIDFADPEKVLKAKGTVEDTEYMTEGKLANFFAKRGFVDKVHYASQNYGDNLVLDSMMLTEISISFTLVRDRERVRKMIKDNKRLRKLKFENTPADDPSQIYETFKSLMINHPNFQSLEIRQRHEGRGRMSEFEWRHIRDPKRMEVLIQAYTNDKIGSMLQKYSTSITDLKFQGISETNANILERSFRPKKGPFKLKRFVLSDLHLTEPNAIEMLQKVVLRSEVEEIWVLGEIPLKNTPANVSKDGKNKIKSNPYANLSAQVQQQIPAVVYADFIVAIRSRLTNLRMWGKGTHNLLRLLSERHEAVEMPLLTHLAVSEDTPPNEKTAILNYEWVMSLIMYKTPLDLELVTRNGHLVVDKEGRILHIDIPAAIAELPIEQVNAREITISSAKGTVLDRPIRYQYEEYGIQPLKFLDFKGVYIREADWNILLQLLDWTQLREFKMSQRNPLPSLVLRLVLKHIQVNEHGGAGSDDLGTQLRTFSIEGEGKMGPTQQEITSCMEELEERFTVPVKKEVNAKTQVQEQIARDKRKKEEAALVDGQEGGVVGEEEEMEEIVKTDR
ncbi:hypothetical protein BGZ83_008055, partial [Gryganskiella cystojenkinii]